MDTPPAPGVHTSQNADFERFLQAVQHKSGSKHNHQHPPPELCFLKRGRPPKADSALYSSKYLAVKRFRQKRQQQVHELEALLSQKQAEVSVLVAEQRDLQSLALYKLSRLAFEDDQAEQAGCEANNNSSSPSSNAEADRMKFLNLQTGQFEVVPPNWWKLAAQHVLLKPHQRQQLEAAWDLIKQGIEKVNKEREELLQKLKDAEQQPVMPPAIAATAGSGVGSCVAGCFALQRLLGAGLDLEGYEALADSVDSLLLRGRAITVMIGWSVLLMFDNEQMAQISVGCYPRFPMMRAIAGCLLNKPEYE
eukprot:gene12287-12422_t